MPKLIEGLREALLQCSRELLLKEGYEAVTIRGVAGVCGVAAGTVYNYFSSKDMLIASVMLEDWQAGQQRMQHSVSGAASVREGLNGIITVLDDFCGVYRRAWSQFSAGGGVIRDFRDRHDQLVAFLSGLLRQLGERFALPVTPLALRLASEALLAHAQEAENKEELVSLLIKLL